VQLYSDGEQWYTLDTAANVQTVAAENIMLWMPFEETSSGTAMDISGRGHHGTHSGLAAGNIGVQGKVGRTISFDGVDDLVTISHHADFIQDGVWSMSFWLKTISLPNSFPGVLKKGPENSSGAGYLVFISQANGKLNYKRDNVTGLASVVDVATGSPLTHVAMTYSPGTLLI
jgi:hypothetical protein